MEELINPRSGSIRRFLRRWYGVVASQVDDDVPEFSEIPAELVDWHRAIAEVGGRLVSQNRPIPLAELDKASDGMMIFWVENQGAYYWATDVQATERVVSCRGHESEPWRLTGETLENFLLHCTVSEVIGGSDSCFTAIVPDAVLQGSVLRDFSVLPFPALENEDPSTRLLCDSGALACAGPPPVGYALPGEPGVMIKVAVAPGGDMQKYRSGLEGYILPAVVRDEVEYSEDDLPF
ncbi:hypothetical protein [Streptomyces sp. IMTB 1903]|uniref:hypothetical protein n=1 Tax=Streptomyces sp. IMTB 1903 TaxID=1776680 RepID=UPI00131A808D|nr:hypothetical protein [Streptomyces sp. IMTB 1903]